MTLVHNKLGMLQVYKVMKVTEDKCLTANRSLLAKSSWACICGGTTTDDDTDGGHTAKMQATLQW